MSELTGKTIGQYQLIEGKGETATTLMYKAFQPALNRYVAIKILKPSSARQPAAGQRFRQQADLLAQFHHPRLIEVYETGESYGACLLRDAPRRKRFVGRPAGIRLTISLL